MQYRTGVDYRFPLGPIFLIVLGAAMCFYGWRLAAQVEQSGDHTQTACTIKQIEIQGYYKNRFGWFGGKRLVNNAKISCTYSAAGKSRWTDIRVPTETFFTDGREEAERYQLDHPPGSSIEILYDPDDAKRTLIDRKATMNEYWPFVPGLILLASGLAWLRVFYRKTDSGTDRYFSGGDTVFAGSESGLWLGLYLFFFTGVLPIWIAWETIWYFAVIIVIAFLPFVLFSFIFIGQRTYIRIDRISGYFVAREYLYFPCRWIRDRISAIEYIQLSKGTPSGLKEDAPLLLKPLLFLLSGKNPKGLKTNADFRADRMVLSAVYKGKRLPLPAGFTANAKNAERLARFIGCRLILPDVVLETVLTPVVAEKRKETKPPPSPATTETFTKLNVAAAAKADYRPAFAWFVLIWGFAYCLLFGWATYKSAVAFTWNETPGMMAGFDSRYSGDSDYGYNVTAKYTYEVNGTYFTGERVSASASNLHVGRYKLHDWDRRFGYPGRPVTVFYDPKNPGEAVLIRDDIQAAVCLVMGLLSVALGFYLRATLKREKALAAAPSSEMAGKNGFIKGGSVFRIAERRWYLGAFILIAFSPAMVDFFQYQRDMELAEKALFFFLMAVSLPLLLYRKESVVDAQTGMFTFSSSLLVPLRRYSVPLDAVKNVELSTESSDKSHDFALWVVTKDGRFSLATTGPFITPYAARRLAALMKCPARFTGNRAFWNLADAEESPETAESRLREG